MIETWRWFGPDDPVSLAHVAQAGATGVVSALHECPTGEAWSFEDVLARKRQIEDAGLEWTVVESIPLHGDIKTRSKNYRQYIENYKESLRSVGKAGIRRVCYNFMAVIDWTRTDLEMELPNSARALGFDMADIAAYDIFLLQRDGARDDYDRKMIERAGQRFDAMSEMEKTQLETHILAGLPGGQDSYDRDGFRTAISEFSDVGNDEMRNNLYKFLGEIIPAAEDAGVTMCIHPDDPPFALFGLPRVMSTADDARAMLNAVPSPSNGLTLCAGSFGARSDNDLVKMAQEFAQHIQFVHLRNVKRGEDGSFFESDHLDGDNDMIGLINEFLDEEKRRHDHGETLCDIPMRPDHGHLIGDEIGSSSVRPGYSFAGRMKGLAELRGVIYALEEMRRRGK